MRKWFGRILSTIVILVVVLALGLGAFGFLTVRRSFPQVGGELRVPGLSAPVEVYRDGYGVPHIYAQTSHDLFLAQGYIHAQDRFWQMDFWRHVGSGRVSELFGDSQVETDAFLRTLGWARVAAQEVEQLDPVSREILTSYTEGVNAYLADHQGAALSLEYAVLKLQNGNYQPEPWQPLHTLTWAKAMAWNLGGNMRYEQLRAAMLKILTPDQVEDLFPPYPDDHPYIVPDFQIDTLSSSLRGASVPLASDCKRSGAIPNVTAQSPTSASEALSSVAPGLEALERQVAALEALLGPVGTSIGSNSWALSGARTATGQPILANDPHLGVMMPSIWYEVGLHCAPQGPDCPYELTGVSFAGVPGVVIGHNDRIAWGFTNVGPDVQDLYIEKINPANPDQYEYEGQWVDMDLVQETIQVAGGEPVELTVRYTRHGPLIWQDSLDEFREEWGVELPETFGIALRWTALDPGSTFQSIWRINRAQDWDEFRDAVSYFDVPSQNMLYADVQGNIGYQTPGRIPIRAAGHTGELPVPGWTGENEWQGFIPFEELPRSFNPPEGYIVTANNAVVGPDYPYTLGTNWDTGFRAQRIVDMIQAAPGPLDLAAIQQMQGDNKTLLADELLPVLLGLPLDSPRLAEAQALLEDWDGQEDMDSAAAALFEVFWKHLLFTTFDELGEDNQPGGGAGWYEVVRRIVPNPDDAWWDVAATAEVEGRDAVFRQALAAAVDELEASLGEDPADWAWGDLHTITFGHESFGQCGIAPIEAVFNRGPYACAGGEGIVNATGWEATEGYEVDSVPSMRMIVDLSDLSNSLMMHTTGQSGHAYHANYIDMADPWRYIEYHPMLWDQAQVEAAHEAHLILNP